jgi:hypothetical protein
MMTGGFISPAWSFRRSAGRESILGRFDVTVISRYFPEFKRELPRYLSPP